jgi:hypothetical protein
VSVWVTPTSKRKPFEMAECTSLLIETLAFKTL